MAKKNIEAIEGEGGTFYVNEPTASDSDWNIWWEDFHIIGCGATRKLAIQDAQDYLTKAAKTLADHLV